MARSRQAPRNPAPKRPSASGSISRPNQNSRGAPPKKTSAKKRRVCPFPHRPRLARAEVSDLSGAFLPRLRFSSFRSAIALTPGSPCAKDPPRHAAALIREIQPSTAHWLWPLDLLWLGFPPVPRPRARPAFEDSHFRVASDPSIVVVEFQKGFQLQPL